MAEESHSGGQAEAPAAPTTSGPSAKLFLGGLSWETDEDKLRSYFSKYGDVEDVVVMRDRATRKPRGFGFVTFRNPEIAALACKETHNIDGRTIDAKPSVPQGESHKPRSKKIFVGGLSPDLTEEQFKEYFSKFGLVTDATIMVDHSNNRSRGFGFVTFEEEDSVQAIFKTGTMHMLAGKQVEVKSATPKGSGPLMHQPGRGGPSAFGFAGMGGRGMGGMAGRGYEGYGQPGYGSMGGFGFNVPVGQYGMYGYGMQGYGGYPGMMMGYGGAGGGGGGGGGGSFGQYGQYGQQQQQQGQERYQGYGSRKHLQQSHGPGASNDPPASTRLHVPKAASWNLLSSLSAARCWQHHTTWSQSQGC